MVCILRDMTKWDYLFESRGGDEALRRAEMAVRSFDGDDNYLKALRLYKKRGMVVRIHVDKNDWPICPLTECKHKDHSMCKTKKCYINLRVTGGHCNPWFFPEHRRCRGLVTTQKGERTCLCPHHGNY